MTIRVLKLIRWTLLGGAILLGSLAGPIAEYTGHGSYERRDTDLLIVMLLCAATLVVHHIIVCPNRMQSKERSS